MRPRYLSIILTHDQLTGGKCDVNLFGGHRNVRLDGGPRGQGRTNILTGGKGTDTASFTLLPFGVEASLNRGSGQDAGTDEGGNPPCAYDL